MNYSAIKIESEYFFYKIGETVSVTVKGINFDGSLEDITLQSSIISLDDKFIQCEGNQLKFIKEGTAVITAYYTDGNDKYETSKEYISITDFYKKEYLNHFFSVFDAQKIKNNIKLKIMFDSIFSFFDIINAYKKDLTDINDKSKFLSNLGMNIGFERNLDLFDSESTDIFNELYKELIKNMIEIIRLRGTKLSYDLFFGALGYDIEIDEFWRNTEGKLIQIDDFALGNEVFPNTSYLAGRKKSTFYAYNEDGVLVNNEEKEYPDPRKYSDKNNDKYYASKSNYLRPLIFPRDPSITQNIGSMNSSKRKAVFEYLELLRPGYAKYLPLVVSYILNDDILEELEEEFVHVFFKIFELEDIIEDFIPDEIIKGALYNIIHYLDSNSIYYDISGITYDNGFKYDSYALFDERISVNVLAV